MEIDDFNKRPFLKLKRECAMTFCCFNRPKLLVFDNSRGNEVLLGSVMVPWKLMERALEVYDHEEKLVYTITASCFQCGFCCRCPCEKLQSVNFQVLDANNQKVADMQKVLFILL